MYSLIETLSDLIRIPSVAGDRYHCELALEYMLDKARDIGLNNAKALLNGRIGVVEIGEGDETLGIITHMDVAGPGSLNQWDNPPFEPVVGGGRLYGRGVVDNKGAAMTALLAMREINRTSYHYNVPMKKKIRMIIGTEQMTGGLDMKKYLFEQGAPDYSFAPDGTFPVGNMILGSIQILMSFPIEKQGQAIRGIKAGLGPETMPSVCKITLNSGRSLAARGKDIHIAASTDGNDNAILNMASALDSMEDKELVEIRDDSIYRVLKKLRRGFLDMTGAEAGMPRSRKMFQFEDPGLSFFVPTAAFISDKRLCINISGHYNIVTKESDIVSSLEEFFREEQVRIDRISSRPPSHVNRTLPFVREFREAYEHVTGEESHFRICPYDSYAQIVPNTITFGPVMPDMPDTRNQVNESISMRDLMFMQTMFERAMSNIVFQDRPLSEG